MTVNARPTGRFVYGMTVRGLDAVAELDPTVRGDDAITVNVTLHNGQHKRPRALDADRCVEPVGAAHQWVVERAAGTARLIGPPLDVDLIAHPCLAPVAIAFNRWAGRESFHAACFAIGGQAYGVIGPRGAGKSTLMAGLAHAGITVLADDIVITDGADVFAGPRCVDLRTHIPGIELATVSSRLRTRYRLPLPSAPARLPLAGWIFLHWGPTVSMTPCAPTVALSRLAEWRGRRVLASDPAVLLELGTRPAWDLVRPADWRAFGQVTETLQQTLQQTLRHSEVLTP